MRVLVAEDDPDLLATFIEDLAGLGHQPIPVRSGEEALERLAEADILLSDVMMTRMDGLTLLRKARAARADLPVILITAHATVGLAVEAMREGAADFIEKPFGVEELDIRLRRVVEMLEVERRLTRLERENEVLRQEIEDPENVFEQMLGKSPAIREIFSKIDRIAPANASVMILGESGTGKELAARAIHRRSLRSEGPFVKMNCSVFNEGILESELFGHEKGSFTGALRTRIGRFELADGGSIFLDEVGDLSALMQLKLLRVLQEREFERVGSTEVIRVDVRVIAATNKDLEEAVRSHHFREDLYFRLNVVTLELPPLRERGEDVELLLASFATKYGRELGRLLTFSPEAVAAMKAYPWPGNIREVENVVQTALLMAQGDVVQISDLPPAILRNRAAAGPAAAPVGALKERLWEYERSQIASCFERNKGNISRTAEELGLERNCLRYKLRKFGLLSKPSRRQGDAATD